MSGTIAPVAAWPDYVNNALIAVGSDGQIYTLPLLEDGKLIATQWIPRGPPLPGSAAARALGDRKAFTVEDVSRIREIGAYLDTPEVAATEDGNFLLEIAKRIEALQ